MINFFLKYKSQKFFSEKISKNEVLNSRKVLFSIFTRYGDTIINLVVIKEFIIRYPDKEYLILIPPQMTPYVENLLPNISFFAFNKRNFLHMYKVNKILKNWAPDIGFNPWSNGLDSCYFISYAKKYFCYRNFNFQLPINHYEVVRKYLGLPTTICELIYKPLKKSYRKVLICPAWKKFDALLLPCLCEDDIIIHSKADMVVPFEDSELLAETYGCTLIDAGYDHRMSDRQTLELIKKAIKGEL